MPLIIPSSSLASALAAIPPSAGLKSRHFLVFFASPDPSSGQSWCGDCRNAVPLIEANIPDSESTLIYAGSRAEWKDPSSVFRTQYKLTNLPTIVRLDPGPAGSSLEDKIATAPRLVEREVLDEAKLKAFVAGL